VADLGTAAVSAPQARTRIPLSKMRADKGLGVCTAEYRSTDVWLGNQDYGPSLDSWSLGCLAAELCIGKPLFASPRILEKHFGLLGAIPRSSPNYKWWEDLPFFGALYSKASAKLPATQWPPHDLRGCPEDLVDFVQKTVQLQPEKRMGAESACLHPFVVGPRSLSLAVSAAQGKTGIGSIAVGVLNDELLEYLQDCSTWERYHSQCEECDFGTYSVCMGEAEKQLRFKSEFVGYIDADNPPQCKRLNGDGNLKPIASNRLSNFVKAVRSTNRQWLNQLSTRIRAKIRERGLPSEYLKENGAAFLEEDFADTAFMYASVQVMKTDKREDGWHTDGGASLLHAAVTLFGSRTMQVQLDGEATPRELPQRPGSFYIGNLCAMSHNVVHDGNAEGCHTYAGPHSTGTRSAQIAIMLRTDVFRGARARSIDSTPGPAELYYIVNEETAKHLAEQPFKLPDLAAVAAEAASAPSAH